jgi:hypothetical protein
MLQQIGGHRVDLLTAGELNAALHRHLPVNLAEKMEIEKVRGMKLLKLPLVSSVATSASFILSNSPTEGNPAGPDSGYLWRLWRLTVASSAIPDTAQYQLYAGSDLNTLPKNLIDAGPVSSTTGNGATVSNAGSATDPSANTVITQIAAGSFTGNTKYTVTGLTYLDGTVTAADDDNMRIVANGGTLALISTGFGGGPYPFGPIYFTTAASPTALQVEARVAASGASAVYHASIDATPTQTTTGTQGLQVNQVYYPASHGIYLWSGEQIYVNIIGATVGNSYTLSGVAVEVPVEMQGKIL